MCDVGVRGEVTASPCLHKGSSSRCSGKSNAIREGKKKPTANMKWDVSSEPAVTVVYE